MADKSSGSKSVIQKIRDIILRKPFLFSIIAFIIIGFLSFLLINNQYKKIAGKNRIKDHIVLETIQSHLQSALTQSMSATQSLSSLIGENGLLVDFDSLAANILSHSREIDALLLAPGGVIKNIYPFNQNEDWLYYNILNDSSLVKETEKAIQNRGLYFTRPPLLRKEMLGIVGRLPVFVENKFWGFSSVFIEFSSLLKSTGIDSITMSGYRFQIAKLNPENNRQEFFFPVHTMSGSSTSSVIAPDGVWEISITPVEERSLTRFIFPFIILGALLSLAVAWISWLLLKRPSELEKIIAEKSLQLEKSAKRNNAIVSAIPDLIFILDGEGNFLDYNNPFEKPLYEKPENFIGKNIMDVLPGYMANPAIYNISRLQKEKKPFVDSYQMNDEHGNTLFYEATYSLIGENEVMVIVRDITARIDAEKTSSRNEEKLRYVLTSSADDFYVIDKSFDITLISDGAIKNISSAWGTAICEGINILTLIPQQHKERIITNFKKVFKGQKVEYDTDRNENGKLIWNQVNYLPIFDKHNEITGAIVITRDITQRKIAEEKLKQSVNRFELIGKTTNDAVWEWDLITGKLWANETHQHLYGLTTADPVPNQDVWISRIHPDDQDKILKLQEQALISPRNIYTSEYRINVAGKGYRNIFDRGYIVRDEKGKAIRMMGSMMDITELKQAEAAIKESEAKYRAFFENSMDGILLSDQEGKILAANPAACEVFGMTETEICTESSNSLLDIDDPNLQHFFEERNKTGKVRGELNMLRKDGSKFIADFASTTFRNANGEQRNSIILRDVSERKKIELELKEAEEKFRNLVEQSLVGVYIIQDGKFAYVNPQLAVLLGYQSEELINKVNVIDVVHPNYKKTVTENIRLRLEGLKDSIHYEIEAITKQNEIIQAELYGSRTEYKGKPAIIGTTIDISHRKKAEEALRKSEQRYRSLIEQASDYIMITDTKGNFIDVNSSLCKVFGYTKEELLTMNASGIISPAQLKSDPLQFEPLMKGQTILRERKMVSKDGNIIDVEANIKLLPDGRVLAIARDIRERKKSEKALLAMEETRRLIMDSSMDAIVCMDTEGLITVWTPQSEKIFGWKEQEVIGKKLSCTIIPTAHREKHERGLKHYLKTGKGRIINKLLEFTALRKDGTEFPVEISIVPVRQDGREFFCGFIRDITERKLAETEINKAKELSDQIIDSLPGIFYLFNESGKYLRWNNQFEKITGYSSEEIFNKRPWEMFQGDDVAYIKKRIQDVFQYGVNDAEAYFIAKDGSSIPFYFKAVRINYENQPCLLGYGIDISDRKKAEEELKESYSAIRNLSEHLQNIREDERSHIAREIHDELGQQLTVLKMDASWLNKKLKDADENVRQKLKDLLELMDSTVKTVRRISSELRPSLLDDMGLVPAMEWHLKEFEKRTSLKVHFTIPSVELELPDTVKTGLFRIFQESLTNVARHANAKKVEIHLELENDTLQLSISDDGKGFEMKEAVKKKTLGILGMQERSFMMGGKYEVSSKPGQGTTINVFVPYPDKNYPQLNIT